MTPISARSRRPTRDHDADQRAVAQADQGRGIDAVEQPPSLILGEHRRLAATNDMFGPAHRMGRIHG
jgi:hypothetical protein